MDLGGKEDYIYVAASQICLAQECEANGKYDLAFSYYKTGVGTLLAGVQGKIWPLLLSPKQHEFWISKIDWYCSFLIEHEELISV